MNLIKIKTSLVMLLMIAFLIMALITKDVINSKLYASLAIITWAFAIKFISRSRKVENKINVQRQEFTYSN
jgi:hypothetical protein